MSAGKYNFVIQQGATFTRTMTLRDKDTQTPINLTGATVRGAARVNYGDPTPLFTFTCALSPTPTDGTFTISLTDEQTTALDFEKALYDIEIKYSNGTVDRILNGNVVLSRGVTQ